MVSVDERLMVPRVLQSMVAMGSLVAVAATAQTAEERAAEAITSVRQWRYEPATYEGEPVPVIFNLTVNFSL